MHEENPVNTEQSETHSTESAPLDQNPLQANEIQVDTLGPDQIAEAAAVLAQSFSDDPSHTALFPNANTRMRILHQEFTAACHAVHDLGEIHTASHDGVIYGVAIWVPPGEFPFSPRRQFRTLPNLLRILAVAPGSFRRFVQLSSGLAELHPDHPYWYLLAVGVDPDMQGHGIGTRLLEPVLANADETDQVCYLETASKQNVDWYRSLGFGVDANEVPVTSWGPPHWSMLRQPRTSKVE